MKSFLRRIFHVRHVWLYLLSHALVVLVGLLLTTREGLLMQSIGASVLATGLAGYVVFGYVLVSEATRERLSLLARFGITSAFESRSVRIRSEYDDRLQGARRIDILGFGLSALREDYRSDFRQWKVKAKVRILLLDPNYPSPDTSYAAQRDREEDNPPGKIATDVNAFLEATAGILEEGAFEVRLYRCLPSVNIFRIDDDLFWGPYLVEKQSRNCPTFIVQRGGLLFTTFTDHFEVIWSDDSLSRRPDTNA